MSDASNPTQLAAIAPLERRAFVVALLSVIFGTTVTYLDSGQHDRHNPAISLFVLVLALAGLGLTVYWFSLRKRVAALPRAQRPAISTAPIGVVVVTRLLSISLLIALGGLAGVFSWAEWLAAAGAIAYAAWRTWAAVPRAKLGIASAPYLFMALLGGSAIFELIGLFIGLVFRHR